MPDFWERLHSWQQYLNNSEQAHAFYSEQAISDTVGSQTSLKSCCQVI